MDHSLHKKKKKGWRQMVKKFNFEESLRQNGKEEKEGNKVRKIYGSSSEEGLFLNATLGYVAGSPSIVLFLCVLTDDIFALSTTALPCPQSRTDSWEEADRFSSNFSRILSVIEETHHSNNKWILLYLFREM